jgi:uncharacterized membrane protein YpjA
MLNKLRTQKFLIIISIINILAGLYSIFYYLPQLEITNPLLWVFVIDCPLYSVLFGIIIYQTSKNKFNPMLGLVSIIGNIKFGMWTILALTLPGLLTMYPLFVVGHLLLIFETILLYKLFKFRIKHMLIVLAWFLLNDILDYFVYTHPYFEKQFFNEIMIFSFVSSVILVFVVSIIFSKS